MDFNLQIKKIKPYSIKLLFLYLLALQQSCAYDHIGPPPPCSCDAPITNSFQSVPGVIVNTTSGFQFLSITQGFYNVCNDLDPSLLKDGLMVVSTGRLKTTCTRPADVYHEEQQSFVLVDQWQISQDSLFRTGPIAIHLIHSEDYGYAQGFGYKITTSGFKIVQPIIPVVGGNQVFKTPSDAFKVAVLVAYKINLKIGLPAITMEDLYFLKLR